MSNRSTIENNLKLHRACKDKHIEKKSLSLFRNKLRSFCLFLGILGSSRLLEPIFVLESLSDQETFDQTLPVAVHSCFQLLQISPLLFFLFLKIKVLQYKGNLLRQEMRLNFVYIYKKKKEKIYDIGMILKDIKQQAGL